MKQSRNTISDWLKQHGDPKIDKKVLRTSAIKDYCKNFGLKFKQYTSNGFIAESTVNVIAGMEYQVGSCKILCYKMKTVSKKKILSKFIYYPDGDIVDDGVVN